MSSQQVVRKKSCFFVISLAILFSCPSAFAAWVWSPEAGKFVNPDEQVQGTPQEQYDYAMEFYKKKNLKDAVHQFRMLLKKYPGSQVAPESQYRLGVIHEELGDFYKAFRAYRDLIQRYPQTERMVEAIEREFRIGNLFLSGSKAKVMGLAILPSGPRAIEVFKHIVEAAPYGEYGEKAQFHLGLAYKKVNQFEEAIQAFQTLIDQYPKSELLPQARFQIADTSYLQSVVATRDQRVIDRASKEIDRFLTHYPNSSVSEKAAKLRQEIDEKNAEKNYRIALFYEKENFLDSAFIYYRDVSARYPHTPWGEKATSRLRALERPAEFLKSQEAEISARKEKLLSGIQAIGNSDPAKKRELEAQLKRTEKEQKALKKSKPETIKKRLAALKQKEALLKEKRKALKKKKKHFSKNTSEDLVAAFDKWETSLKKEERGLIQEKMQIEQWGKGLGVETEPFYSRVVPFGKEEPTPLEQVERLEAERLDEIAREKRKILIKKEALYHEYEKMLAPEGGVSKTEPAPGRKDRQKRDAQIAEIQKLEKNLQEKEDLYKKLYGVPAWQAVFRVPTQVLGKSVDVLNPFDGTSKKDWSSKSRDELKALEKQWNDKVNSEQALVDVIKGAFDDELNKRVEKEMLKGTATKETDATRLRKTIKQVEREIRSRYNEIQDRNDRKNELLEEVERILQGKGKEQKGRTAERIITAPARGAYLFGRSFLFGLPQRDVELTEEAKRSSPEKAEAALLQELREQIELESLLIETRNQEILKFKKELEALRAQSSLMGARPVRPLLVKYPYVFIREAITSANRLVPKKDRKEALIDQLHRETEKLEQLKREHAELKDLALNKSKIVKIKKETKPAKPKTQLTQEPLLNQKALQDEIKTIEKQLQFEIGNFESKRKTFEKKRWKKISLGRPKSQTEKLKDIEKDLVHLIEQEQKIQEEEKSLWSKKKEVVEKFLQELPRDPFTQDLNREREEINSRLVEIQKRETHLGEELRRFRPQALPHS